ncbi:MAG: histidine kinase N-terminal 7TM domain-containing protein, partial [Ardenticatenaceae bacterium]
MTLGANMNFIQIVWIAIPAFSCLLYGLLFYLRRTELGLVQRWFSAFLLAAAFWSMGSVLLHADPGFVDAVWLARLLILGNFALPLTIFGFTVHFLSLRRQQALIAVGIVLYLFIGILNLAGYVVVDTEVNQGLVRNEYGWGIYVASVYWSFYIYSSMFFLWRERRRTQNWLFRQRLTYLLGVLALLLGGNLLNLSEALHPYPADLFVAALAATLIS